MDDVWPVAFVGWKSKGAELLEQLKQGQVEVWTGKLHLRKGARFVAVLEDGAVLAAGEIVNVQQKVHHLSLTGAATSHDAAPRLSAALTDTLRAVPRPFLKLPLNAIVIVPDKQDAALNFAWFDAAAREAAQLLPGTTTSAPPSRHPREGGDLATSANAATVKSSLDSRLRDLPKSAHAQFFLDKRLFMSYEGESRFQSCPYYWELHFHGSF